MALCLDLHSHTHHWSSAYPSTDVSPAFTPAVLLTWVSLDVLCGIGCWERHNVRKCLAVFILLVTHLAQTYSIWEWYGLILYFLDTRQAHGISCGRFGLSIQLLSGAILSHRLRSERYIRQELLFLKESLKSQQSGGFVWISVIQIVYIPNTYQLNYKTSPLLDKPGIVQKINIKYTLVCVNL